LKDSESLLLLRWATFFGLTIGFGQWLLTFAATLLSDRIILMSPESVWMAPLVNVGLLLVSALAVLVVRRAWPRLLPLPVVLFLGWLVFLITLFGVLRSNLLVPRLHRYAWTILAAGIAVQVTRLIRSYPNHFAGVVRRTTPVLIIVVVILAGGQRVWQVQAERRALAALPPTPDKAANVLLIVLDTVRAQNLSLYGYRRETTPILTAFARAGVTFEKAVSTAPWTLPSHSSMFTGRFPHEVSAGWQQPLDDRLPTLAEALRQHGYATAGFVANWGYTTSQSGLSRGFTHYEDYPLSAEMAMDSSWLVSTLVKGVRRRTGNIQDMARKSADQVSDEFLRWLFGVKQRPFFAFLNYYDAHVPYIPPPPFDARFGPSVPAADLSELRRDWSREQIEAAINAYDGAIAYLDQQLGLLFDRLREEHLLENTIVVVTSDHGEQFGEHGLFVHGNSLYWPSLNVPLVIVFPPEVPAGKRVEEPVSLRDLPATILDLLHLDDDIDFPGRSLATLWHSRIEHAEARVPPLSEVDKGFNLPAWFPVSKGDMRAIVLDGMHYIRNGDGREELYDLARDRSEENNLAGSVEHKSALDRFRRSLSNLTSAQ
jgi:arylsulfatase A-like enzyme